MIRMTNVEKTYENGTHALNVISFEIQDGEFVFLVGPSGSGKSTIIKLLTGELVPSRGRVMINGFSMSNITRRQIPLMRRTVGVIFQDFRLIGNKTVYDNLSLAMRAVGASAREIKSRIPYVLGLVGLDGKGRRFPDELSGGEQQRVAIARALVNNPSTIVADEPTGNLDPARSLEIMTLLERINALGTTVVVVTHEKSLVNHFDKRVIMIDHGVVAATGVGRYEVAAHAYFPLFLPGGRGQYAVPRVHVLCRHRRHRGVPADYGHLLASGLQRQHQPAGPAEGERRGGLRGREPHG